MREDERGWGKAREGERISEGDPNAADLTSDGHQWLLHEKADDAVLAETSSNHES